MSWKLEPYSEQAFSEYAQSTEQGKIDYADPRFYQSQPASIDAPHPVPLAPLFPGEKPFSIYNQDPRLSSGEIDQQVSAYRGPTDLENYTSDVGSEQRDAAENGSVEKKQRKKGLARLGGLGALIAGLLVKLQALVVLLMDIKWVAFAAKFGLASITALISIGAYALLFGWSFAIGLVALLFIHEMGHVVVMRMKGLPISGMVFIPMLGAAVFMSRMPANARDEAEVGIAGPIAGAVASSVCLLIAFTLPNSSGIWAALAYFGFFMNLFNLIPIVPFDGGRVLAAIDRRIWIIGFLGLVAIQIWEWIQGTASIWLLLFILVAATQFWARKGGAKTPEAQAYYAVPLSERIILGLVYFGLAAILVLGMTLTHNMMSYIF
jgi:Zn-dependent protease